MEKERQNVPLLRFPEFSGEWVEKKLKEIGSVVTGTTPSTFVDKYYDGDYMFVSPYDISNSRYVIATKTTITELGMTKCRSIPKGSVMFVCIGSTIGKIAQASLKCATNQQINTVVPFREVNAGFLYSLLENNASIIKLLAGEQAVPMLNKSDFSNIKLKFTSIDEQTKIADFLSVIDDRIDLLTQKKKMLETYKKGVMQKLFSQELRFKDENGEDFPHWQEKNIGAILKIGNGKDYKHLNKGEYPVFGTGGQIYSVDDFLYDGESVFIGRKGTINKPSYYNGKFWTVDTLFYTHLFVNSLPKFIYYIFQSINWLVYNEATGVPSLSKSTIESIKVIIPTCPEQQKIANFLSAIDNKITALNDKINNSQQYKKGLLQQMFV